MPGRVIDVRGRSFNTVLGGFEPEAVRGALDAAAADLEALESEASRLREQHASIMRDIETIAELERSMLRSCVAAEEDARIKCGAARRYATRVVALAEEKAAEQLGVPQRERDRATKEIDQLMGLRQRAADAIEALAEELQLAADGRSRVTELPVDPLTERPQAHTTIRQEPDHAGILSSARPAAPAAAHETHLAAPGGDHAARELQPGIAVTPMVTRDAHASDAAADLIEPERSLDRAAASINDVPQLLDASPRDEPLDSAIPSLRDRRWLPAAAGASAAVLLLLQGFTAPARTGRPVAAASLIGEPRKAADSSTDAVPDPSGSPAQKSVATSEWAGAALTMHIRPLRVCWVRVIVDDRTDAREVQPGEDIVLEAKRTIVLRAGDAGALSIELNGRVLPPLGQNGQVVERRFTAPAKP